MTPAPSARSSRVLGSTESVCPVCLARISAQRIAEDDSVYLVKHCPEHGEFKTVIWRGLASYEAWGAGQRPHATPPVCPSAIDRGCPYDCGPCADHRQHTCCVVLELTQRCNLSCPVCFASASNSAPTDPSQDEILAWCRTLLDLGGPFNLHLSGGEPTLRNDLPQLIRQIRDLGFTYFQLNTNGIRLARQPDFASELKSAGLSCVFLQFDGITDDVFLALRGRPLLDTKLAAIENCARAQLGVVLVPTLTHGVNTHQIGAILQTAIRLAPTVRAVHFQPVSYFGRFPGSFSEHNRITIPEVIRHIDKQTGGIFPASSFYPASGENPYCSFHGKFWLQEDGKVSPTPRPASDSCCGPAPASNLVQLGSPQPRPGEGARRAQRFVSGHWTLPSTGPESQPATFTGINTSSLDAFLAESRHTLSVSCMAFQDAWNLDLDRLRDCFLQIYSPTRNLVPLCAFNLTSSSGQTLYRSLTGTSHREEAFR